MHSFDNGARQAQERHWREGLGNPAEAPAGLQVPRAHVSQAPVSDDHLATILDGAETLEAVALVLDLSYLVDDVSDEERAARELVARVIASAGRIFRGAVDTGLASV